METTNSTRAGTAGHQARRGGRRWGRRLRIGTAGAVLTVAAMPVLEEAPVAHALPCSGAEETEACWWGATWGTVSLNNNEPGAIITATINLSDAGGAVLDRWVWTDSAWSPSGTSSVQVSVPGEVLSSNGPGSNPAGTASVTFAADDPGTPAPPWDPRGPGGQEQADAPGRFAVGSTWTVTFRANESGGTVTARFGGNIGYLGWSDTATRQVDGEYRNEEPTARITVTDPSDSTPSPNGRYSLRADSVDPNGDELTHTWDLGNGETAEGATATVQYAEPGNYTVKLRSTDPNGLSGMAEKVLTAPSPTLSGAIDTDDPTVVIGSEFEVAVSVIANADGVGDIGGIGDLGLTVPDFVEIVATEPAEGPPDGTLTPGSRFDATVTMKATEEGTGTIRVAPSGVDANGAAVLVQAATQQIAARPPGLEVELVLDDDHIDLEIDAEEGEVTPKDVVVTMTVTNVSAGRIENVRIPEKLTTGVVVGEQKLIEQTDGPTVDAEGGIDETDVGTMESGDVETFQYTLEVSGDGGYSIKALVQYTSPGTTGNLGEDDETELRADLPTWINANLHFLDGESETDAATVQAGDVAAAYLTLENLSNIETITFAKSRLKIVGAAGGGFLTDIEEYTDPHYASGNVPVPKALELEPHADLSLRAFLYTRDSSGTRATIKLEQPAKVKDDFDGERDLNPNDLHWTGGEEPRRELRLSVLDPPAVYGDATFIDAYGAFTIGFVQGADKWLRNTFTGMAEIRDAILSGDFGLAVYDAIYSAEAWVMTWYHLSDAERRVFVDQTATQIADAQDRALAAVRAEVQASLDNFANAYFEGNVTELARLTGHGTATVALEVGMMEAAGAKLVQSVAESRALAQLAILTRNGLSSVKTGQRISRAAAHAFGYQRKLVDDLAEFARRNNLNMVVKPRDPDAIRVINGRRARMKPEFIKPKTVNDIDIDVLGFPPNSKSTVTLLPDLKTDFPDADAVRDAARDAGYDHLQTEAAVRRYHQRLEELDKYLPELREMSGTTVRHRFNTGQNGLDPSRGVYSEYPFELVEVRPGVLEARIDRKPVTSDVDFLSITQANGQPLTPEQRLQIYEHLSHIADIEHPETATWIKDGLGPEFRAKREIFEEFSSNDFSSDPALQFGGDGNLRAVRFNESSGFRNAHRYLVKWDGGFIGKGNQRVVISGDMGYQSLRQGTAGIVIAGGWTGRLDDGTPIESHQTNEAGAGPYRSNGDGGVERYEPGGRQPSERFVESAGGGWVDVPMSTFQGLAYVPVLPQTQLVIDVAAGESELPVFTRSELSVVQSTGEELLRIDEYFVPGQPVVVDPGGPNEEFAVVETVEPFALAAPLQHDHTGGELVIAIPAAEADAPTPTTTPATTAPPTVSSVVAPMPTLPRTGSGRHSGAISLAGALVAAGLLAMGATRRRAPGAPREV